MIPSPIKSLEILDPLCHDGTSILYLGNLAVDHIGQITKRPNFHSEHYIYPIGYRVIRRYFDVRNPGRRVSYQCEISEDADEKPSFKITSIDDSTLVFHGSTCTEACAPLIALVHQQNPGHRRGLGTFFGETFFGLSNEVVRFAIECLRDAHDLEHYRIQTAERQNLRQNHLLESLWCSLHASGSARCEPHRRRLRKYHLSSTKMFGASFARIVATTPNIMKKSIFHSDSEFGSPILQLDPSNLIAQYRHMKLSMKVRYRVSRSAIQGMGLYAIDDFEPHEMVCEYVGEIVGQKVADHREQLYESQRIGTYFFKVAEDCILDATRQGNVARFINHSCAPNCYTKCLTIDGAKKILIFTAQHIPNGMEFTYDYRLPLEPTKIPCYCGATTCRRTMN